VSLPAKGEGKLRAINKVVNQFASSMKHRPFINDMDKARTLGFIAALRDVITQHGSKPIKRAPLYEPLPMIPVTEEQREQSRIQISRVREHLKKGKTNELDDTKD
jgi:hypothetical protein